MFPVALAVGALVVAAFFATLSSALHVVEAGTVEVLVVFGEERAVLEPGLVFVPPFVSETRPVDARTMTVDTGDRREPVPEEFEDDVREVAGERVR
jgi:regulator of protease activity HflC (stomatin/prohibitin superfamily)